MASRPDGTPSRLLTLRSSDASLPPYQKVNKGSSH